MYDVSNGTIKLAVNGTIVSTQIQGGNDWSGSNSAAVGTLGGGSAGGVGNGQLDTESFDGKIALFRVYRNQILNADEIKSNYYAGIVKIASPRSIKSLTQSDSSEFDL